MAIGLLRVLRELGIAVPDEVSVFGHDDVDLLAYLSLGLTTVRIPKREMAERAVEILVRHIESRHPRPPERVLIDSELVVRDSTGPVPAPLRFHAPAARPASPAPAQLMRGQGMAPRQRVPVSRWRHP